MNSILKILAVSVLFAVAAVIGYGDCGSCPAKSNKCPAAVDAKCPAAADAKCPAAGSDKKACDKSQKKAKKDKGFKNKRTD